MSALNPAVVLAALDAVLEVDPRSPARVSIMNTRVRRLRAQVLQYVDQADDASAAVPTAELQALVDVLADELGWDWPAAPGVPSSEVVLRDVARAVIAAGFQQLGPITDEMVTAALWALGHSGSGVTSPRLRAALEAADGARS